MVADTYFAQLIARDFRTAFEKLMYSWPTCFALFVYLCRICRICSDSCINPNLHPIPFIQIAFIYLDLFGLHSSLFTPTHGTCCQTSIMDPILSQATPAAVSPATQLSMLPPRSRSAADPLSQVPAHKPRPRTTMSASQAISAAQSRLLTRNKAILGLGLGTAGIGAVLFYYVSYSPMGVLLHPANYSSWSGVLYKLDRLLSYAIRKSPLRHRLLFRSTHLMIACGRHSIGNTAAIDISGSPSNLFIRSEVRIS